MANAQPFQGKADITTACKDLMLSEDEGGDSDFVVLSFEGKKFDQIVVKEVGYGCCTDEWREKWCDETALYAFVLKLSVQNGGFCQDKVLYCQWVGKKVKIMSKGKAKMMYQGVMEFVRMLVPFSGNFEARNADELEENDVVAHLGSRVRPNPAKKIKKSKVKLKKGESVELKYADHAKLQETLTAIAKDPYGRATGEEIAEGASNLELAKVGTDEFANQMSWVALSYCEQNHTTLVQRGCGSGTALSFDYGSQPPSAAELKEQEEMDASPREPSKHFSKFFKADNIVMVAHRILRVPEQYRHSANKGKFLRGCYGLVMWQGEQVDVMQKALSSHHWKQFTDMTKEVMNDAGVYLQPGYYCASTMSEVTPMLIRDAMKLEDPNL